MGFFSWQCAKSKKPVMAEMGVHNTPWRFASEVIVLFKDGDRISGTYDGYGHVDGLELLDYREQDWRMVIRDYYDGETFAQLEPNGYDRGQGWFYSDDDLKELFG